MCKKYSYEYVKSYFEKQNYSLISKEYINSKSKLEYICDKGHKNSIIFNAFNRGIRCPDCAKCKKFNYEFVKSEFEKIGYKLLSTEYKNSECKLKYICDKGHQSSISFHNFKAGQRCKKCSIIIYSEKSKHSYEFIKEQFEKEGYTLLSSYYINNKCKLNYICNNGHKQYITYHDFQTGYRCRQCYIINNSGKNSCNWKGGVTKLNLPLFDTFAHQIDFCEEIRRDHKNNDLLQVKCIKCNEWFTPTRKQVTNRINTLKTSTGGSRFYCSDECKKSCSIYGKSKYPKGFKPDYSREVQSELAVMVFKRDSYECQRCGNKDNLECHHYESIYSNPIESADIDACVTLCHKCHVLAHKNTGCRRVDLRKENLCK